MANALNRFGNYCREARAKHGLNMAAQAEALGQDVVDISAIESGKVIPSQKYVEELCNWLNVSAAERTEFERRIPQKATVIAFSRKKDATSSVKLFRKVSKMTPRKYAHSASRLERECMMTEDFIVEARSTKKIEEIALAWRDTLGVANAWAPDMIDLIENKLPNFFANFGLIVRADAELGEAEGFTEFSPPQIVVRKSVYLGAARGDGRSRMTLAHELGHLVMHAGVQANARMISGNKQAPTNKLYRSAEWQARKFASLFLMPSHIVRDFGSAEQLAESCCVSQQAAVIRFSEVQSSVKKLLPDCVQDTIRNLS